MGLFAVCEEGVRATVKYRCAKPGETKLFFSVEEAMDKVEMKDGMTISLHHHLRNGDDVIRKPE